MVLGDSVSVHPKTALQAATILVAMASGKNIWRPKLWRKPPIGDLQIKRETYLKKYQI